MFRAAVASLTVATLLVGSSAAAQDRSTALSRLVPDGWRAGEVLGVALWQWGALATLIVVGYVLAAFVAAGLLRLMDRVTRRTPMPWDDFVADALRGPARLFVMLLLVWLALDFLALGDAPRLTVERVHKMWLIGSIAWAASRFVAAFVHMLEERVAAAGPDDLDERAALTQGRVLRRIASLLIWFVAVSLMLVQFDVVRDVGVSLLASAGLAGVVLGFAAQKTLGSLLAGIQLSVAQPIRLGDVVVVEGEWGHIEEITLTYVAVKLWDLRRLVVPVSYFIEKPFQNWTHTSAEVLGTVELCADHAVPVEQVRAELERFVGEHALWDRAAAGLQVTEASEYSVTLRALVSAADASKLWDLRCDVREHLVSFLQGLEGGRFLPRIRRLPADG